MNLPHDAYRWILPRKDQGSRTGRLRAYGNAIDAAMQRVGEEAVRKMFGGGDVR